MNTLFLGLGYIGLPTAAVAASRGLQVTGVDINPTVVETINRGEIHIVEPGLRQVVHQVVAEGRLHATTTPVVSDVYLVVVPTPFKGNHEPDISYVEAATRSVIPLLKEGVHRVMIERALVRWVPPTRWLALSSNTVPNCKANSTSPTAPNACCPETSCTNWCTTTG